MRRVKARATKYATSSASRAATADARRIRVWIAAIQTLILRASAVAALLALLVAYLVARAFTRRIRRIENYAKELVNADYSGSLAAEGDDELGSVARSLRIMAEHFPGMLERPGQES